MNEPQIIVGLDVGTTKVACVVGMRNEHGEVNVLGMGKAKSEGVVRGSVYHVDRTQHAIRTAVELAEKQANVEIANVYVSVTGDHLKGESQQGIVTLNDPEKEIAQEDVDRLCSDMYRINVPPGREILHVVPQEFRVDNKNAIKDPVGMNGVRLEGSFHIVTGEVQALNTLKRTVRRAGLDIAGLVLHGIASSTAVLAEEEKDAGVIVIDLGGGTTDVAVYKNGLLLDTHTLPFGGHIVTKDIMQAFNLMQKHAQILKEQYGAAFADLLTEEEVITISSLPGRAPREISRQTLARVMQARMTEIAQLSVHQVEKSGLDLKELYGGIVLTGGGAKTPFATDLFSYATGLETREGAPVDRLAKGLVQEVNDPAYSCAVGLMLYGLFEADHAYDNAEMPRRTNGRWKPGEVNGKLVTKMKSWFEKAIATNAPLD